jgi:hypothetical protein
MGMARELKGVLAALGIAIVLLGALFLLKLTTTPERSSGQRGAEELVEEEVMIDSEQGTVAGEGAEGGGGELGKRPVDPKQSLLDAIYDEKQSRQMKEHIEAIRESSR